jgi:hypothetical protein
LHAAATQLAGIRTSVTSPAVARQLIDYAVLVHKKV